MDWGCLSCFTWDLWLIYEQIKTLTEPRAASCFCRPKRDKKDPRGCRGDYVIDKESLLYFRTGFRLARHFCFFSADAPRTPRETLTKPCKSKEISEDTQICHQYLMTRLLGSGCFRSKPAAPSAARAEMSWPPLLIRWLPIRQNLPPPPSQQILRESNLSTLCPATGQ